MTQLFFLLILIFLGNFGETEGTEARVETRDSGSEGRTRGLKEGTQVKQVVYRYNIIV